MSTGRFKNLPSSHPKAGHRISHSTCSTCIYDTIWCTCSTKTWNAMECRTSRNYFSPYLITDRTRFSWTSGDKLPSDHGHTPAKPGSERRRWPTEQHPKYQCLEWDGPISGWTWARRTQTPDLLPKVPEVYMLDGDVRVNAQWWTGASLQI